MAYVKTCANGYGIYESRTVNGRRKEVKIVWLGPWPDLETSLAETPKEIAEIDLQVSAYIDKPCYVTPWDKYKAAVLLDRRDVLEDRLAQLEAYQATLTPTPAEQPT